MPKRLGENIAEVLTAEVESALKSMKSGSAIEKLTKQNKCCTTTETTWLEKWFQYKYREYLWAELRVLTRAFIDLIHRRLIVDT